MEYIKRVKSSHEFYPPWFSFAHTSQTSILCQISWTLKRVRPKAATASCSDWPDTSFLENEWTSKIEQGPLSKLTRPLKNTFEIEQGPLRKLLWTSNQTVSVHATCQWCEWYAEPGCEVEIAPSRTRSRWLVWRASAASIPFLVTVTVFYRTHNYWQVVTWL